ncbi:DUF1735 domain-containing protein [Parabacteroides sp. PFB2-10]|uniref:DUF1735 domain-containing protein n=1 Tax=Parabacteroides sp. PFB2-10 TaxID=1742405 RepID=UPI002473F458|nr:DUF1735 domain-containing protein [Parabacteroides sp. PFB2-10]
MRNLFLIVFACIMAGCADDLKNPIPTVEINPGFATSGYAKISAVSQNESDTYKAVYSRQYGISRDLTMLLTVSEEALSAFNAANGTTYKMLPAEYYTMPASVKFDVKSKNADFEVVVKSKQLYKSAGSVQNASQYALPIRAIAEKSEGVDEDESANTVILHIDMAAATVTTTVPSAPVNLFFVEESTAKETKTMEANLNFTGIDASAISLTVDKNASLLSDPQYKLLPEANYSLGQVKLDGTKKLAADIEFNAKNLTEEFIYVLPCYFKSSTVDYAVAQNEPVYYLLNITGVQVSIEDAVDEEGEFVLKGAYSLSTPVKGAVTVSANSVLPEELTINMVYDPSLIAAYNATEKTNYKTLPSADLIKITNGKINAGSKGVDIAYEIDITGLKLSDFYLVPLVLVKEDMEVGEVIGSEVIYLEVAKSLVGTYDLTVITNERTRNVTNRIFHAKDCRRAIEWENVLDKAQYGFGGDGEWYAVLFSVTDEDMPGQANCKKIEIYTFLEALKAYGGSNDVKDNKSYYNMETGEIYIDCYVYESWLDKDLKATYSFKLPK